MNQFARHAKRLFFLTGLFTAALLTGCGGGGGSPGAANSPTVVGTQSSQNNAPLVPAVSAINPANAATTVALNSKIAATFNTPMNPATIVSPVSTFTLKETVSGNPVAGTVAMDAAGKTAVFAPSVNLAPLTGFTVTITTAARDAAGSALASNFTSTFTTGAVTDNTEPTVTEMVPPHAATNIALNTTISATFSKAMDPTTITTATFTLFVSGAGGAAVPGVVTFNTENNTATFTPTGNLAPNTTYSAVVTTGAKDLTGNARSIDTIWHFVTGA